LSFVPPRGVPGRGYVGGTEGQPSSRGTGPSLTAAVVTVHAPYRPELPAVLKRLAISVSVACVVPGVLFYLALALSGVPAAVCTALTWSYGALVWRWATKRRTSGLLLLTVAILTVRTAITLSTGNTFLYFFQPVVSDGLVALVFLASLATATPVVARLASDFYPMDHDVAARHEIRRLFWRLTLLWGCVGLAKGGIGFWLLESQSLMSFVVLKNLAVISLTVVAVAVTVVASTRVMRREGLMPVA
jgi:intracellular septation protein A